VNRRTNLLLIIPVITALVAYLLTEQLLYTVAAFVAGYLLVGGLRLLLMPPHVHQAARRYQRGDLQGALELTEKAIAARPQRWEPHYLRALIMFSNSSLPSAEDSARRAIERQSDEPGAHLILGQVLFAQGEYAAARDAFAAALTHGGKEGVYQYHAGAAAYRLGDCSEAIPRLELALRLGLDNAQLKVLATFYVADCLQERGEQEEANGYFEQLAGFDDELQNLRHDLQLVADYPERTALGEDIRAIATFVPSTDAEEGGSH
jgi:tetratricopeptide (TPR) repeat protein